MSVHVLLSEVRYDFNSKKEGLSVWLLKRLISQKPGIQGILIELTTMNSDHNILRTSKYGESNPVKEVLPKLNLPDHRYKRRCCILIPAESNSLPHAHTQATKTYYKHQDSRIKKA
ncbi:hypothetical protein Tco_1438705 [Tanacetum coccineum]